MHQLLYFFPNISLCADAVTALSQLDVLSAEIMSYSTIQTVKSLSFLDDKYKNQISQIHKGSAAIMFEIEADNPSTIAKKTK